MSGWAWCALNFTLLTLPYFVHKIQWSVGIRQRMCGDTVPALSGQPARGLLRLQACLGAARCAMPPCADRAPPGSSCLSGHTGHTVNPTVTRPSRPRPAPALVCTSPSGTGTARAGHAIEHKLLGRSSKVSVPPPQVHKFLWDRYRSVRQDLHIQGMQVGARCALHAVRVLRPLCV